MHFDFPSEVPSFLDVISCVHLPDRVVDLRGSLYDPLPTKHAGRANYFFFLCQ